MSWTSACEQAAECSPGKHREHPWWPFCCVGLRFWLQSVCSPGAMRLGWNPQFSLHTEPSINVEVPFWDGLLGSRCWKTREDMSNPLLWQYVCVCVSVLSSCLSFWVGVLCGSVRDCLHVAVCALCREGDGRSCRWPWSQTPSPAQNSGLFLPDLWMARFLLTLCIPEASACLSAMARQGSQTVWKGPMDVLAGFCLGCYLSFPGGDSGKESACQCRGHKRHLFDP